MMKSSITLLYFLFFTEVITAQTPIPNDFPQFVVPGHESQMASLRSLYWLHYPGAGPKATLWDEWLTSPSLWPAVDTEGYSQRFRNEWYTTLTGRIMDDEGYVATHQHNSIAHQLGWPFPFWKQGGPNTWGWHFSLEGVPDGWHGTEVKDQSGWTLIGGQDGGIVSGGWRFRLTEPNATLATPPLHVDFLQSPFLQLRWAAEGLDSAQPFIEWSTEADPEFSETRRMYFAPTTALTYTMIPVYKHPEWRGTITGLRINFGNDALYPSVLIQSLFTQYDTRHNINNSNFVRGCAKYFLWTGDLNFLRSQITRMRRAIRYMLAEFRAAEEGVIVTDWVGHDGRSGLRFDANGKKSLVYGQGIGNNYWDLLPFGNKDTYATIQYYDALIQMAELERAIRENLTTVSGSGREFISTTGPSWNVPGGIDSLDPDDLLAHAARAKEIGNTLFWNPTTQRFHAGIDRDAASHDFGFTFLNLEAIYYDFATPEHADAIMDWIAGDRIVEGDTAQGPDIYHWRFGPRATTKRNTEYYGWFWSNPESIPWGGQVQDGGAVLGFSYYDLMARLKVRGPDDAWKRLQEIIAWFDEVQAAGGYRKYYDGSRDGTLQGGGTAGGLGMDQEFFESVLLPQILLDGFLGFAPTPEGFRLNPQLPKDWPELTITNVRLRGVTYTFNATNNQVAFKITAVAPGARRTELVSGDWLLNGPYIGNNINVFADSGQVLMRTRPKE